MHFNLLRTKFGFCSGIAGTSSVNSISKHALSRPYNRSVYKGKNCLDSDSFIKGDTPGDFPALFVFVAGSA